MRIELKNVQCTKVANKAEGTSKSGNNWKKEDIILTQFYGDKSTSIVATLFGEEDIANFHKDCDGATFTIVLYAEAREYNGRYFNNINVGNWEVTQKAEPAPAPEDNDEDLPEFLRM